MQIVNSKRNWMYHLKVKRSKVKVTRLHKSRTQNEHQVASSCHYVITIITISSSSSSSVAVWPRPLTATINVEQSATIAIGNSYLFFYEVT